VKSYDHKPSWDQIVAQHGAMAVLAAWGILGQKQDTEDVVQESWLECFRLWTRSNIRDWGAMIRVVTTRRAIDALRRRARDRSALTELQLTALHVSNEPSPESAVLESELAARLRQAITGLSDHEATVFSLSCLQALANHEIATALAVSSSNVSSTLHKAREKLKVQLASFIEPNTTEKS
jgi:RNA polymerase sigma factor (sigma-70 family)